MDQLIKQKWEKRYSSLFKQYMSLLKKEPDGLTYQQCREYACKDISKRTWNSFEDNNRIIEIPKGKEFHFLGRVDTSMGSGNYYPEDYFNVFKKSNYIAFSTINNRNISHYLGRPFLVYNILPQEIVHIFPTDSDTEEGYEQREEELTFLPSLWLKLNELEDLTARLGVYNQVTCKAKRNGEIIKPYGIIAFEKIDEEIQKIAEQLEIKIIIVHPDENAINYCDDLLLDKEKITSISPIMEKEYEIKLKNMCHVFNY